MGGCGVIGVGVDVGVSVMDGLAVVVGVSVGMGVGGVMVADGVGAAVGLAVGAGMVAVGMAGVGGCRSDSRMIVNVGVGCGVIGVGGALGWVMGAAGMGEAGAPPQARRARELISSMLARGRARAARICG